ncbi:hypothetical protein QUA03_15050 [Microcoleus sp. S36b_A4]
MGGWWGAVIGKGFGSGFNEWVVGGGRLLARDLVADLTDEWLVGGG